MPEAAIRIEGLSKRYRIGEARSHKTLREALVGAARAPFRRADKPGHGTIWALKDVSFEVAPGEVVGVIGRNGAGKSTLLKILSRITEPTEGRVEIRGRVGSLLEVGTGFHSELTGRENIFLNGAILGMKRIEIARKFDEIVAFAEVEKFLDTSVKHYSSGMYLRLAFAVAAHLEPEILLVDEVLAVGDASFQKKCLGKMSDVAQRGRTILFVSHNMPAITSLCTRALLLDAGKSVFDGPSQETVTCYLHDSQSSPPPAIDPRRDRSGDNSARFVDVALGSGDGQKVIRTTSRLQVTIRYESHRPLRRATFLIGLYDLAGTGIYLLDSDATGGLPEVLPPSGVVRCLTAPLNLTPGRCYVNVALLKGGALACYLEHARYFDVEPEDVFGTGKLPPRDWVLCVLQNEWSFEDLQV